MNHLPTAVQLLKLDYGANITNNKEEQISYVCALCMVGSGPPKTGELAPDIELEPTELPEMETSCHISFEIFGFISSKTVH